MIQAWANGRAYTPPEAVLAQMIMTNETGNKPETMKKDWAPGASGKPGAALFTPDELDLYVNKITLEAYIFHSKEIDYATIDRLEYNAGDHSVDVVMTDSTRLDLGVRIQWLIRPYFTKTDEVTIVRTRDGVSIDGKVVPLLHKGGKTKK